MTLPPTEAFKQYHDRQPLVLQRHEHELWLESPDAVARVIATPRPEMFVAEKATV